MGTARMARMDRMGFVSLRSLTTDVCIAFGFAADIAGTESGMNETPTGCGTIDLMHFKWDFVCALHEWLWNVRGTTTLSVSVFSMCYAIFLFKSNLRPFVSMFFFLNIIRTVVGLSFRFYANAHTTAELNALNLYYIFVGGCRSLRDKSDAV